jgi:uncharacterized protein
MSTHTDQDTRFTHRWLQWKVARERELAHPHGWLALVSLDWLSRTPREYPRAAGSWWQDAEAAYLGPRDAELSVDGEPVTGVHRFELVNSGPSVRVAAGEVEIEVARRSGYLIRVHDPSAPALAAFAGVPTYDPDPDWVLNGRYEQFGEPRSTTVGAVVEGLRGNGLNILFTDETSGVTTYPAPEGNHLPFAVTAGEQLPYERYPGTPT